MGLNPKGRWRHPRSWVWRALAAQDDALKPPRDFQILKIQATQNQNLPGWLAGHRFNLLTVWAQIKTIANTESYGWENILFFFNQYLPLCCLHPLLLASSSLMLTRRKKHTWTWKVSAKSVCDCRAFSRIPTSACLMRSRRKRASQQSRVLCSLTKWLKEKSEKHAEDLST